MRKEKASEQGGSRRKRTDMIIDSNTENLYRKFEYLFLSVLFMQTSSEVIIYIKKRKNLNIIITVFTLLAHCLIGVFSFACKVKLATIVEGDLKAPFSIATTPRYREGRYSFPGLLHYPWSFIMLNVKQSGIKYHFFESLVWLDLRLNPSLLDHWQTLNSLGHMWWQLCCYYKSNNYLHT